MVQPGGLFPMISGLVLLVLSDRLSRMAMRSQNKAWGFQFGDEQRRGTRLIIICGAVLLLVFGTTYFFGYMA